MKVLFVSSGKSGDVGYVVKNQGESLKSLGLSIDYFVVRPRLAGYLSAIRKIRNITQTNSYDLIHAHYSLCGIVSALAGCKPLVVSLMGSDAFVSFFLRFFTFLFYKYSWKVTIVKTVQMKQKLNFNKSIVIPNGVDLSRFKSIPKKDARNYINFPLDRKLLLHVSVKNRPEKNIDLAKRATIKLNDPLVDFLHIHDKPNSEIPFYLNAADALLLTSKREGSVNVIKEAMACGCPIVSTDVGDVKWLIDKTEGCFITTFDPEDVAEKIHNAINYFKKTEGRKRLIDLGLDSDSISRRIIDLYNKVITYQS